MLRCLRLAAPLASEDASDALAIAICHATHAPFRALEALRMKSGAGLKAILLFLTASCLYWITSGSRTGRDEASPRLTFSKSFPGSVPAWEEIVVDKNGAGQYKDDPKDEDPLKFQLTRDEAAQMFSLADKMDHFSHPLESHLKVANMGMKTFRYEADGANSVRGQIQLHRRS